MTALEAQNYFQSLLVNIGATKEQIKLGKIKKDLLSPEIQRHMGLEKFYEKGLKKATDQVEKELTEWYN